MAQNEIRQRSDTDTLNPKLPPPPSKAVSHPTTVNYVTMIINTTSESQPLNVPWYWMNAFVALGHPIKGMGKSRIYYQMIYIVYINTLNPPGKASECRYVNMVVIL